MMDTLLGNINKKLLSKKYDELYAKADAILKLHNPCSFKDGICLTEREGGCCINNCKHSTIHGCSTKCLACKLHVCGTIRYKKTDVYNKLLDVFYEYFTWGMVIPNNRLYDSFGFSKEEHIDRIIFKAKFAKCNVSVNGKPLGFVLHPYELGECSAGPIIYMMHQASGITPKYGTHTSTRGIGNTFVSNNIHNFTAVNGDIVTLTTPDKRVKWLKYKDLD